MCWDRDCIVAPRAASKVVLQEPNQLSGIPEYLRLVTKPVIDVIMSGADATKVDPKQILAAGT